MRLALVLAGMAMSAPAFAQADPHAGHAQHAATSPAVDPDVDAFVCAYFGTVEKGDPAEILAMIDQDFVMKFPLGEPITDRAKLAQALDALRGRVQQTIRWKTVETGVHGTWAWARVTETSTHRPRAGGASRTFDGSHLMILRKDGDRWLLHRDHGSLNAMPAS